MNLAEKKHKILNLQREIDYYKRVYPGHSKIEKIETKINKLKRLSKKQNA